MDITSYISTNLPSNLEQAQKIFYEQFQVWLSAQINDNQFLVAGICTVLFSSLLYVLRNVPGRIWAFLTYRLSVQVHIFNNNPYFFEIANELNKKTIHTFSRKKMLDAGKLTIGMGTSLSWFKGRLVKVTREKEKSDSREFKQVLHLTFPFMTNKKLQKLFNDYIQEINSEKTEKLNVYTIENNYLQMMKEMPKRRKGSIFLPEETLSYIENRIDFFLNNRKWYYDRGIPYKYAILLHGIPGTGKTTLAKYIASYTNRNIVVVSPSNLSKISRCIAEQSEDDLIYDKYQMTMKEESKAERKYLGLMEDIDCDEITAKRKRKKGSDINMSNTGRPKKITFSNLSDLLNSIDGLNAPEDFILVATTNHIDELDPALLRKGRFDDVIEIKPLETPDIIRMIASFREIKEDVLKGYDFEPIPGSILQDLILQYLDRPLEEFLAALKKKESHGQKIKEKATN